MSFIVLMSCSICSFSSTQAAYDYVVKAHADGSRTVHNLYRDHTGKQFITPTPNISQTAKYNYELEKNLFRGTSTINAPVVSARTGAMSAGTVTATIIDDKGKRQVMGEVVEKARLGGRALGKGAATVGRVAASRTPYGIAFMLALEAIGGSKFFWSDEHGDFMRPDNNNMYIVISTKYASESFPDKLDDKTFSDVCANNRCQKVAIIEGKQAAQKVAEEFCKSRTFETSTGRTLNYDSIGWSGYCYSEKTSQISSIGVKVLRWVDYVPMTLDEFIDEGTPEAAQKPNEWVETSDVKPTDEPKVEVPSGSVAQSDPYTDPRDRKVKQTRWDFDSNGRVREREIERPDLTPDSPEAPELQPPVEETPKDGDKDKDKESASEPKAASAPADLCEKNPDILACDKQPEKPEEDEFEIPEEKKDLFFTPDTIFPTTGTCPAPVSFTVDIPFAGAKMFEFDTMPICEIARRLRNLLIAMAWLVTAVFCFRSFSLSK